MIDKTVVVGFSGGVDSSVVAKLLKNKGYKVIGVFMKTWDGGDTFGSVQRKACFGPSSAAEIEGATATAARAGIDFRVIDVSGHFRKHILDYFKSEYLSGRTPNPCVLCNPLMKFGYLWEEVEKELPLFDYFATGHYVRKKFNEKTGRYSLHKGKDATKDQSYFLYRLNQQQLARTIFPLGEYLKTQVKEMAAKFKLGVAQKAESQNFINGGYDILFKNRHMNGKIIDLQGNVLGKHQGIFNYTIGQRRGIGIAASAPLYVLEIRPETNELVVGSKQDLKARELVSSNFFWSSWEPQEPLEVEVKIRYRHEAQPAKLYPLASNKVKIVFNEPQMSITPGQAAVVYQGSAVIGGGPID
ncbi:MAG: tRNA 2-thiouridine(34) synthase MnmA [Deltaproteobacteria bacterium]|jgi:tRNA-specific 2-thiouridylase|nr:tRNA 2-thiouridine(34) synthase MnmA [Deltaproteobacteria bacterium]